MDLFEIYGTGFLLSAVENVEEKILNSNAYVYFDNNTSNLLHMYKKFEVTIISTSLIAIFFDINITDIQSREKLRTIYLGKTADFQRLLLSKELKVRDIEVSNIDKIRQQNILNLKIGAKFEEYYSAIKESINNESIYYFWEYDTPEREWDSVYKTYTDNFIKGEDRLYSYLWNLFLCYEDIDFSVFDYEQKCIRYKNYLSLENTDLLMIEHFIREMIEFRT